MKSNTHSWILRSADSANYYIVGRTLGDGVVGSGYVYGSSGLSPICKI